MPKRQSRNHRRGWCEAFLKQSEEEMQPVGIIQVIAVIANDGRPVVVVEWPSGDMQMVERDEAAHLGDQMLKRGLQDSCSQARNNSGKYVRSRRDR